MEEWKECKLGDIVEINPTESLKKGTVAKKIGMDVLQPYCRAIPSFSFEPYTGGTKFKNGDTIMARITPCLENGKTAMVNILDDNEIGFGSTEYIVFRAKNNITDPYFVYYLVTSDCIRNPAIKSMVGSSGRQRVQTDVVANLSVKVPPLPTQQKIAAILSSLDDKIELNNKINTNLEQQAGALFKNWFVDFEPFGGKMPEGWKEVEFRDVCENITDGVHNTVVDDPNGEYLLLSCKNIKGGILTIASSERKINKETFERLRKRTKLAKGDILLSSVGTVGEMYLLNETPNNYEFQRSVAIIKPNTTLISPAFLYESMLFQKDTIIHSAHGAVQQCIFISDVGDFTTILPTIDIIEKFTKIVQPMLDTITANQHENQKLANIRDTLLPKLMDGEISI